MNWDNTLHVNLFWPRKGKVGHEQSGVVESRGGGFNILDGWNLLIFLEGGESTICRGVLKKLGIVSQSTSKQTRGP